MARQVVLLQVFGPECHGAALLCNGKLLSTPCLPIHSLSVQVQYTRQALAYLNSEPAVERYAWFTSRGYGVSRWQFAHGHHTFILLSCCHVCIATERPEHYVHTITTLLPDVELGTCM